VLQTLRVSKVQTAILILSGMAGSEDKGRGLGFGAGGHMTQPLHKDGLGARVPASVPPSIHRRHAFPPFGAGGR